MYGTPNTTYSTPSTDRYVTRYINTKLDVAVEHCTMVGIPADTSSQMLLCISPNVTKRKTKNMPGEGGAS